MRKGFLGCLVVTTQLAGLALAQTPSSTSNYHPIPYPAVALGRPASLAPASASAGSDLIMPIADSRPAPTTLPATQPTPDAGSAAVVSPAVVQGTPIPVAAAPVSGAFCAEPCSNDSRMWVNGEYLLWWSKVAPLPLTPQTLDYGAFSGFRITVGGWLDADQQIGLEGRGFWLPERSTGISAPGLGTIPILGLNLSIAAANASVTTSSTLWGADLAGTYSLVRGSTLHAELLGGFRYIGLDENLTASADGVVNFPSGPASGTAVAAFHTLNSFYGGQMGARAGARMGRFTVDLTGTVALGVTQESLQLDAFAVGNAGAITKSASANPRTYRSPFAVAPVGQARIGYDLTRFANLFVAYDFLYISDVARPGNQALTFIPSGSIQSGDYWAQGITIGAEFRF